MPYPETSIKLSFESTSSYSIPYPFFVNFSNIGWCETDEPSTAAHSQLFLKSMQTMWKEACSGKETAVTPKEILPFCFKEGGYLAYPKPPSPWADWSEPVTEDGWIPALARIFRACQLAVFSLQFLEIDWAYLVLSKSFCISGFHSGGLKPHCGLVAFSAQTCSRLLLTFLCTITAFLR